MCNWVSVNASRLRGATESGECYGVIEHNTACIIRSVWNRVCAEASINGKALLGHLRTRGLIETAGKGYTKSKYIGGQSPHCVWLKLPGNAVGNGDELPL